MAPCLAPSKWAINMCGADEWPFTSDKWTVQGISQQCPCWTVLWHWILFIPYKCLPSFISRLLSLSLSLLEYFSRRSRTISFTHQPTGSISHLWILNKWAEGMSVPAGLPCWDCPLILSVSPVGFLRAIHLFIKRWHPKRSECCL